MHLVLAILHSGEAGKRRHPGQLSKVSLYLKLTQIKILLIHSVDAGSAKVGRIQLLDIVFAIIFFRAYQLMSENELTYFCTDNDNS